MEVPPEELPLQRAARGVEVRNYEEEIRFDDGQVVHLYGSAVPLRDPSGAPRGRDRGVRRRDAAQAGGGRHARGRSPQGRVPGAAVARAAQPAGADPHRRPADAAAGRRGDAARARGDPPPGAAPRAPRRRPARRLARGARQGHARRRSRSSSRAWWRRRSRRRRRCSSSGGTSCSCRSPPRASPVEADEVRLTQVVSNLLTNAARYTPPGGRIEVTAAREGDEVVLRVRDNGMGIDSEPPAARVRHVRAGRARPRPLAGGARARAVAGANADRRCTEARSARTATGPGRGSEFTVRLPASVPPRSRRRPPGAAARAAARRPRPSASWSWTTTATPRR